MKEEQRIYWAGIEFSYDNDSPEYLKLKGGFVYGFVCAVDAREALRKFNRRLKDEKLSIEVVEFISIYDLDMEWETEKETKKYFQLAKEATTSFDVVLDDFYSYEP